jgi:hypothetical protein
MVVSASFRNNLFDFKVGGSGHHAQHGRRAVIRDRHTACAGYI